MQSRSDTKGTLIEASVIWDKGQFFGYLLHSRYLEGHIHNQLVDTYCWKSQQWRYIGKWEFYDMVKMKSSRESFGEGFTRDVNQVDWIPHTCKYFRKCYLEYSLWSWILYKIEPSVSRQDLRRFEVHWKFIECGCKF